jgi:cytoskeleton protein RodZ
MSEVTAQATSSPSAGAQLKQVREKAGIQLITVAKTLNVSVAVLEALERDDYGYFSAPVFARGHLKKYANYFGLSERELLLTYDNLANPPADPSLIPRMKLPTPNRWQPLLRAGLMLLLVLLLLAGVGFFIWHGPMHWFDTELGANKPPAAAEVGAEPNAPGATAGRDGHADEPAAEVPVAVTVPPRAAAEH